MPAIEMKFAGLSFAREMEMPIFYRSEQIGTRRVDFFVEEGVMVELKAMAKIEDVHKAQAINYLEAYNIADGLLINFGLMLLQIGLPLEVLPTIITGDMSIPVRYP